MNPKHWHIFHDLFLKENAEFDYEKIDRDGESTLSLKFYCEPAEDKDGFKVTGGLDIPQTFYSRDEGTTIVKTTGQLFFRTYQTDGSNILTIFATRWISVRLIYAMTSIAKARQPKLDDFILPIMLKLGSKEKELQKQFTDVRRFRLKDVPDVYVKGVSFGGIMLQDSTEYKKYLRDSGGKLISLAFRWNGITIMLSSDGSIFTYTTFGSDQERTNFFKQILDILLKLDVVGFVG